MNSILVSIIVPIYNSSKFLTKCLDSLVNQSLKDIEIILINDGATDNSGIICDRYAQKDKRIKVFHIENRGASYAKNIGIQNAEGNYIGFVDSDDFIDLDMFNELYKATNNSTTDIVNCDYYYDDSLKESEYRLSPFPKGSLLNRSDLREYILHWHENKIIWFAVRNIYRRKLLIENGIIFNTNLRIGIESTFLMQCFYHASSLMSINKALYHYVRNPNSITQKKYKHDLLKKLENQYGAKLKLYNEFDFDKRHYVDLAQNNFEHLLFMLLNNVKNSNENGYIELKKIRNSELFRSSFKDYKMSNKVTLKMRIIIILFKYRLMRLLHFINTL